jgi:hypothetical protein
MHTKDNYTDEDRKVLCDGCEEDCKYNKKERKKEPSIPDIVDEHFYEMLGEEPVSEDLEKIVEEIAEPTILNAYGTKELARRLRNTICGTSVSEDLEEAVNAYIGYAPEVDESSSVYGKRLAFKAGAKWQKQQDQSTIELAEDHAMLAGIEKMKEQLIAKAVDVTVHIEAGNYPYIPQIELYDYDKDIPLAKEGDRYKVILIKED